MTRPFSLSLSVRFATPLSSGAAGASAFVADKVVVRNGLGEYILPGSQVRGTLRHACERLMRAIGPAERLCRGPRPDRMCPQINHEAIHQIPDPFDSGREVRQCSICAIFGSPYFPSPIQFHDLVCENPLRQNGNEETPPYRVQRDARLGEETLRTMVSLNRQRRVAEEQRLFFIETTPAQPSLTFTYEQAITGVLESEAQAMLLLAGIRSIVALGGGRSRGLGWIEEAIATAYLDRQPVTVDSWEALRTL